MTCSNSTDFDFYVIDLNGNARGKRIPQSVQQKVLNDGVKLPRSSLALDFWGDDVEGNGLVFETGDSDGICFPIELDTRPMPWTCASIEQLQGMMFEPDGSPFDGDPRQLLKRTVEKYKELGYIPVVATELEFYLFDAQSVAEGRPRPKKRSVLSFGDTLASDCYSTDVLEQFEHFFTELRQSCEQLDIDADTIISEMGPGQFEVNLQHKNDALAAADQTIRFKRLVKGLAGKHNCIASFMAKPYSKQSGNGFHTHFSLLNEQGENVFDNGGEKGTDILKFAIAGLLETMPESMLIFAPHLNSYRRFQAGSHAPTFATWGYENRTTAIRVPDSTPNARRIEHRVAGADANPYLVLTAILVGALHGICNAVHPSAPLIGNGYSEADNTTALPRSWDAAISVFVQAKILGKYLGKDFIRIFTSVKRQEQSKLLSQISDIEYKAYLGRL